MVVEYEIFDKEIGIVRNYSERIGDGLVGWIMILTAGLFDD